MADPDDLAGQQDDEEGGGKKSSKLPIIIAAFVVLLGAVGVAFYLFVFSGDTGPKSYEATPRPTPGLMVKLSEPFTANVLPDNILSCQVVFEISQYGEGSDEMMAVAEWAPLSAENMRSLLPKILHAMYDIIGNKTKNELNSTVGKRKTIEEIKIKLNEDVLSRSRIKNIYFEKFVIQ